MQIKLFHHTAATELSFPLSNTIDIKGKERINRSINRYVNDYGTCKWFLAKTNKMD